MVGPLAAMTVALAGFGAPTEGKIAILPSVVAGPHGTATSGQVFESALQGLGVRLLLEPVEYETLFLEGASSKVTEAARCGSDEGCVLGVLEALRAKLGLRVVLNFAISPPLVTLNLTTADRTGRPASAVVQVEGGAWAETIEAATDRLLTSRGYSPAGRLEVQTTPPDLRVEVLGGTPYRRVSPQVVHLPPGQHRILARDDSGKTTIATTKILPNEVTTLALTLTEELASSDSEESLFGKWWFWTGLGAIAVGAATAAALAASGPPTEGGAACLCVTTPTGTCGGCR